MPSLIRRLIRALPRFPRRRYNIFAGTNTAAEWRRVFAEWITARRGDEEDVIRAYESRFAETCGVTEAVCFGAGRMALYAILEALGIGEGDEIVLPAFTCVVVPNAMRYRGVTPVYVDIEPRTFNIDVSTVEAAITPHTKALYAQHTFGVPCAIDTLREIARRHGLRVIEDAAHSLGATYDGRACGSLGDVALFSTDHSKAINTYLGGMATTSDPEIAGRLRDIQSRAAFLDGSLLRRLRQAYLAEWLCYSPRALWIGRTIYSALARLRVLFSYSDELRTTRPTDYPYPGRLSSTQAAIGLSQLASLGPNLAHRRRIARWLDAKIGWNDMTPEQRESCTWLRYSFLVADRARFVNAFERRFDLGIWFTSVVEGRSSDLDAVAYATGSCPVAEFAAEHIVNLPTHPRVPLEVIQREVDRNWGWLSTQILDPAALEPQRAQAV